MDCHRPHRVDRSRLRPHVLGKSEELIRRLRRAKIARKRVQVFKPVLDDRDSPDEIVSHRDQLMKSTVVASAKEILDRSAME